MAKIEIPLKKDYAGAFKYWVDTNTENGVCTIPEYICKGIVGMLGKQPVATDTNVGDAISRQAAIDAVKKHYRAHDNDLLELIAFDIEHLPPAQPERKKGKWGDDAKCSNCGHTFGDVYDMETYDAFCRNCGAKMEGLRVIK